MDDTPIQLTDQELDEYLEVALAETFSKPGTADVTPADKKKLKGILGHYSKMKHGMTVCMRDQMKHGLSRDHAARRCAVLKDIYRGTTKWRSTDRKKNLCDEELAEYRLEDVPEEFFTWLEAVDLEEYVRLSEEEEGKVGIVRRLVSTVFPGWKLPEIDDGVSFMEEKPGEFVELETLAKKGDYTPEQWANATLLHFGPYDSTTKGDHAIPVRKPDGTPDPELMKSAVRDLFNYSASQPLKRRAARRLMFMHDEVDDNPPDSLKGLAGHTVRELGEGENDFTLGSSEASVYRLPPIELAEAKHLKGRLWKKPLLEVGRKIRHGDTTLDFSQKTIDEMVAAYHGQAFDQVPLLSEHTDNVFAFLGELVDLTREGKRLVGTFRVSKKGEQLLKDNPKLPTSVGFVENYTRSADGRKFGSTLQHVATVFKPAFPGLEPWETVQMGQQEATEFIDLSQSAFEDANQEKGELRVKVETRDGKTILLADSGEELELTEDVKKELGLVPEQGDEAATLREQVTELSGQVQTLSSSNQTISTELAEERARRKEERVEKELDEYLRAGVPKADIDTARPVLLAEAATSEVKYVELSESGASSEKTSNVADQVRKMLDSRRGTIEYGERGSADAESTTELSDHQVIQKTLGERNLGPEHYEAVAVELVQKGEIRREG